MGILGWSCRPTMGHKLERALPIRERTQRRCLGEVSTLGSFMDKWLPVCVAGLLLGIHVS